MLRNKDRYENKLDRLRLIAKQKSGKSSFVTQALLGNIDHMLLDTFLNNVKTRKGEVDFDIIKLIRLLYMGSDLTPGLLEAKKRIVQHLSAFPFWPIDSQMTKDTDKIVFWSENHILMMLGSWYLIRQWELLDYGNSVVMKKIDSAQQQKIDQLNNNHLESRLLFRYLSAHCSSLFHGLYEINSHVYLPYSISALLNLYDFAVDTNIKQFAHQMIDMAVHQVLLCTTPTNSVFYAASARAFLRTRQRSFNHNINQLINLLNNDPSNTSTPDPIDVSTITDFLITSNWRPDSDDNIYGTKHHPSFNAIDALTFTGFLSIPMNHSTDFIRQLYQSSDATLCHESTFININKLPVDSIPALELTPFYWSAGLITHPSIVSDTREYQRLKGLNNNKHLWYLSYFSPHRLHQIMDSYDLFSTGQVYTGITLNVYKHAREGLCLNSFEQFNPHKSGFQQLPWIANIAGIPIWSQAGLGKHNKPSGIAGFSMTNTHNPWVSQKGSILVACYKAPKKLVSSTTILKRLFSYETQLFWPELLFTANHLFPYHKHRKTLQNVSNQQKFRLFSMFRASKSPTTRVTTGIDSSVQFKDISTIDEYLWVVGVKNNCVVAVLCTDTVSILRMDSNSQTSMMTGTGGKEDFYHIEIRPSTMNGNVINSSKGGDHGEVRIPLTRLLCTSDKHCWVVVVDVLSNYGGSIERFHTERLCKIAISDNHSVDTLAANSDGYMGDRISQQRSKEFIISVKDGSKESIDYFVNDD